MDISGKVAVVTGSGQGLGLAYASALAEAGAAVVVNDVDDEKASAAAEQIEASGGTATAVGIPVGDAEAAEKLVSTAVDTYGRLDVMVTNAGILRDRTLWNMSDDDFDDVIRVHLRGTFTCARAAATPSARSTARCIRDSRPTAGKSPFIRRWPASSRCLSRRSPAAPRSIRRTAANRSGSVPATSRRARRR